MTPNPLIENVRKSLGRVNQFPDSPFPEIYLPRQPGSVEGETDHFIEEVNKLSGTAQKINQGNYLSTLEALIKDNDVHKVTLWQTPLLRQLRLEKALIDLGMEIIPPTADKHELALCDLGITESDYLLAETGTLVLTSSSEKPRSVSLVPRIHLAITQPFMFRVDMQQVFIEAKNMNYLVFITGPSRTADIEMIVTLGVHGPQKLYVWMFSNQE